MSGLATGPRSWLARRPFGGLGLLLGLAVAGPATAQQATINVTVSVPKPTAEWKAWSTDPGIAMVVLQTTLAQPTSVTSTVSLLQSGRVVGKVPGNITRLPEGTRILRTPELAVWSRMTWSGTVGRSVQEGGKLPPGSYQLCVDVVVPPPPAAMVALPPKKIHRCASFAIIAKLQPMRPMSPAEPKQPKPRQVQVEAAPPMTVQPPPPHLIAPASRSGLLVPYPTFQWTPVVSPSFPRPTYLLRIARVEEGQTPEQALGTARPVLEREVIGVTTFPYPPSAPPLEPGQTYAWQVQALAMPRGEAGGVKPLGMNQGRSQIYTFHCAPVRVAKKKRGPKSPTASQEPLYNAALSGRLVYTFQPAGVPKPRRVDTYLGPPPQGTSFELQGQTAPGYHVEAGQSGQQGGQGAGQQGGGQGGGFHFPAMTVRKEPLAGVTVRLVVRYRTAKQWIRGASLTAGGRTYTDNDKVVASTVTGKDGRFNFFFHDDLPTGVLAIGTSVSAGSGEFGYHESAANLVRFYTVEVGDPHYASPSDELERDAGGNGDVGTLVALVRTYQLRVKVTRAGTKAGRAGLRVQLLRPYRAPGVPATEGTAPTPRKEYGVYEIIADTATGAGGIATFTDLVKNVGAADGYRIRVTSDPNNPTAAFYPATVPVAHAMLLDDPVAYDDAVFNEDYRASRLYHAKVEISPKPPELRGKVTRADDGNAIPGALIVVVAHKVAGSLILHPVKRRDHGKFVITGVAAKRRYVAYVHASGFRPDSLGFTPDSGVITDHDFVLQPDATVTLALVDENGTPVPGTAWVGNGKKVDAAPVFGSEKGGGRRMSARSVGSSGRSGGGGRSAAASATQQAKASRRLHVRAWEVTLPATSGTRTVHVDAGPGYFPTDTTMTIPKGKSDLGQAIVYLRVRRLRVKVVALKGAPRAAGRRGRRRSGMRVMRVTSGASEPAIQGATVRLPDVTGQPSATTDASGVADFTFKATAPDSLARVQVQITPPPGSDYMPASPEVLVPESRTPRTSVLGLVPGATIEGTVYAGVGTDSVVPGARVFIPGAGSGGADLADTADAKGHYALHGAPTGAHWVRAGKAGSEFTGDSARVAAKAGSPATQDFHLTAVDGLPTSLLGLEIEVQSYTKTAKGAVVSGRFTDLPSNDAFATEESGRTLEFDSVTVTGSGKDAVPEGGTVHVVDSDLPLHLFGDYLVRQHRHGGLDVEDQGGGAGGVVGPVTLLSGSFPLNSAELVFEDTLHLLVPGASGAASARLVTLVAGGASPAPSGGYAVGTLSGGNPRLVLYGFDAEAGATTSRLTSASLQLDATLHTAIPGVGDLAIHVADLTVKPGQGSGAGLQPASGDQALSLKLGAWTLETPSWNLQQGKLHLVKGVVHVPMTAKASSGSVDFPFTGMEVTPNTLEGGKFGGGPILLGGFVPLQVQDEITFLRDTPTGPWTLFGKGGRIAALPGMAAGDEVKLEAWRFLSNGEKHFSMEPGAPVRLYGTGDLAITTLGITETSVSFAGALDLHIPGLDPQPVVIDYTREAGASAPTLSFNPIDIAPFDIGGPRVSVHQGVLDATGFHGDGVVTVPHKFSVASHFLRTPLGPNEKIEALPLPNATLDVGQVAIAKLKGGATVSGGKWGTDYKGHVDVGGQVSGDITIGIDGTTVNAGTGGLAVSNIPTPFGNMAITLNFPEQRLEGSVQTDKDIAKGAHVKGTSEMVISGKPGNRYWYFFTGAAFTLKTPHLSGSAALIIGQATLDGGLLARFATYGRRPVPNQFHTISGFYMEGEASIPLPVCPNGAFDIGVADVEVWCNVWGDVRLGANFQQRNTYFVGIGAGIDAGVKGGVGMGLCVHVSAEVKAALDGEGAYRSDGAWYARGDANLDLLGSASYGVGIDDVCLNHSTSVHIGLGAEAQVGYDWASNIGPHAKVYFR